MHWNIGLEQDQSLDVRLGEFEFTVFNCDGGGQFTERRSVRIDSNHAIGTGQSGVELAVGALQAREFDGKDRITIGQSLESAQGRNRQLGGLGLQPQAGQARGRGRDRSDAHVDSARAGRSPLDPNGDHDRSCDG